MKSPGIISTAILSLLLGVVAPALTGQDRPADQQDHTGQNARHQDKPRQQDRQQKPSADTQRQQDDQQQRDRQTYPQSRPDEQGRQAQRQADRQPQQTRQMQRQVPEQQRQARDSQDRQVQQQRADRGYDRGQSRRGDRQSAWEQHRANNWQSDHRTWQQRGGYDGYRVPQTRYRGYFGPQHGFRIGGLPFMTVGGYPRFQYSGYWISLVDPWPGEWGNNWYDSDDVYVSYVDNGYYLFNSRYPGMGIAISISQ